MFGADYDHHFYTLAAEPPFEPLGRSNEFCIASAQDPSDCERLQFVSGIHAAAADAPAATSSTRGNGHGGALLLSFGVNDCEAKVASVPLDDVWAMLRPRPGGVGDVCR